MTDSFALTKSTLKALRAKDLAGFNGDRIGPDTIQVFLRKGWSLAICCRNCRRLKEWTPYELLQRYGDKRGTRIDAIARRLACAGDDGCGSHDIAVWPHPFDGQWTCLER